MKETSCQKYNRTHKKFEHYTASPENDKNADTTFLHSRDEFDSKHSVL